MSVKARDVLGEDPEVFFAEARYDFISKILPKVLKGAKPLTLSDLLDKVFLDKYVGIPIFLTLWWALFRFTFDVSAPFSDMIDMFFSWLGEKASEAITNEEIAAFISDAVLGGLGGVLVFLPPIFLLFFRLSLLEESGYWARVFFVVERVMYERGLHG